jgi:hypothetical protein
MIRWDEHPSGWGDLTKQRDKVKWVESIDITFPEDEYSLYGTTHARWGHSTDIYQGQIGNCWFMHGASVVARKPARLEKIFYNDELSSMGIYGLKMYILGVPTTVTIDDIMPLSDTG